MKNSTTAARRLKIACLMCLVGSAANAASIEYDFNIEFSGGQAPAGPAPWITATFTDGIAGHVLLTINTSGLRGSENISEIDFNFTPDTSVTSLLFTSLNGGTGTIAASSVNIKRDGFKADGDGLYDISLTYPTGSGFNKNLTSSYDITLSGAGTISAASFFVLSTPSGGHGPFYSAAHVQNTTGAGSGGSGWVAPSAVVPLPAALPLLLSALGVFGGFRRRPISAS